MSSPDRMEMHARAIADLVGAMSLMEAEQQAQDRRFQVHEEWVRAHEEWMQAHNDCARGIQAESRQNQARISENIGALTNMQADIARLDAAS